MSSYKFMAHVFCNGQEIRTQQLGTSPKRWRAKQVLKALFNEIKPLAKKNKNNIYYIELKRHEYSVK
jgi:hypothetical protein